MVEGEKQLLSVSILPVGAMGRKISYSSSDQSVASVNGFGRIHALSEGTTNITVKCGEKENSFQLTVKKKKSVTIEISDYEAANVFAYPFVCTCHVPSIAVFII